MSAVAENTNNNLELSDIFKLLGKCGKESQRWKKIDRNFWNVMSNLYADVWSKCCGTRVVFRLYGSAVEDLKSEEADDVGDLDLVVFSDSDDLLIDEEMIEYLPEHPIHVRIKGGDHSVLRFSCVEDSSYVSTSAVQSIFKPLSSTFPSLFESLSSKNCATIYLPHQGRQHEPSLTSWFYSAFGRHKRIFISTGRNWSPPNWTERSKGKSWSKQRSWWIQGPEARNTQRRADFWGSYAKVRWR